MYDPDSLSETELEYYSRQIVLNDLGVEGQLKLKASRVCVVGVGGLGSPVCIQLASMGVGYLRIIDRDIVDISNLQRQHIYGVDCLGVPKVEAASRRLKQLNPFVKIDPVPASLNQVNAEKLLGGCDVVVDCLDSMSARYVLNRACVKLGIPLIYGAVIMKIGNTTTILPGETACLECFQGGVDDTSLPSCATAGVHPSIISIIASVQVSEVVRLLLGQRPVNAGELLFCDLADLSFERIRLSPVDSCPVCGKSPQSQIFQNDEIEEICGREGNRVFVYSPIDVHTVNMKSFNSRLEESGYTVDVKAELGITFSREDKKFSVLKSGVIILEGLKTRQTAEDHISQLKAMF